MAKIIKLQHNLTKKNDILNFHHFLPPAPLGQDDAPGIAAEASGESTDLTAGTLPNPEEPPEAKRPKTTIWEKGEVLQPDLAKPAKGEDLKPWDDKIGRAHV